MNSAHPSTRSAPLCVDDICAVIVTRGDVWLTEILTALPYPQLVVWNDLERGSQGCYGRYLAAAETTRPVIYFQDDDLVVEPRIHDALISMFEPGRMLVNMPSPWYETCRYDQLDQALVGAGSLVPAGLWQPAIDTYLGEYPADQLFLDYVDVVVGMLTPYTRVDLGYRVLPCASAPNRIWTQPGAPARKAEMQRRVIELRDAQRAAA